MNPIAIKAKANECLTEKRGECSFLEYKKSEKQLDKILKTICAFGNNYFDNDLSLILVGVEENDAEDGKGTPQTPIVGVSAARMESVSNLLKSLRSFTYPNVKYEVLENEFEGTSYLIIAVERQNGGPFAVTEKAEKDKRIGLKPGRYIRYERDSRLARVDEEYDLLRKFSAYHFSSSVNMDATLDDLSFDYMKEYMAETSGRSVSEGMSKEEIATALHLLDSSDSGRKHVTNFGILMFAERPDRFIKEAAVEVISNTLGSPKRMEAKTFVGPVWKQYRAVVAYISDYFIRTVTLRFDDRMENERVSNFPYVAVEELVGNAIVHKDYEKGRSIQIYVTDDGIDIVNYNKPLPPLSASDLNSRTLFRERDFINPEIREMFKSLGIIESYGSGIGEAKRACELNRSPKIEYKVFEPGVDITSVRIPMNQKYWETTHQELRNGDEKLRNEPKVDARATILAHGYSRNVEAALLRIAEAFAEMTFSNADIVKLLGCAPNSATGYTRRLRDDLGLIEPVKGLGSGRFAFVK